MALLRSVTETDLPVFFQHQRDAVGLRMAGVPSREEAAFFSHWHTNVLRNLTRAIEVEGSLVGYVGSWSQDGLRLVAYWIGREHWGKGIATQALRGFLALETTRPLHAYVAAHNVGSRRVLEKCGFRPQTGEPAHQAEGVAELLLVLGAS